MAGDAANAANQGPIAMTHDISNSENYISSLAEGWVKAKAREADAVAERRVAEDELLSLLGVADNSEKTETFKPDGFTIKITGRIDRKVDSDKIQALATDAGLTDHLFSLLRWKPEINKALWDAADTKITGPLAAAITAKPGRPSFTITRTERT